MIDLISYGATYCVSVVAVFMWLIAPVSALVGFFVRQVTESKTKGGEAGAWLCRVDLYKNTVWLFGGRINLPYVFFFASLVGSILTLAFGIKSFNEGHVDSLVGLFASMAEFCYPFVSKVLLLVSTYFLGIRGCRFIYKLAVRIRELEKKL